MVALIGYKSFNSKVLCKNVNFEVAGSERGMRTFRLGSLGDSASGEGGGIGVAPKCPGEFFRFFLDGEE